MIREFRQSHSDVRSRQAPLLIMLSLFSAAQTSRPPSRLANTFWLRSPLSRKKPSGFSTQQALMLLLICFPLGVIVIGLAVVLIHKQVTQVPQATPSAPQQQPSEQSQATQIQPLPSDPPIAAEGVLSEDQARSIVEEWLTVKQRIFAPPFDTNLADQVVAEGPLWTDLVKTNGSVEWLKSNNSYYSYSDIRVNRVLRYLPSPTMPSIVVSVTESSTLHSPKGSQASSNTRDWIYTLKEEGARWKIWDYRKQS
jgi:hypothetical protein